jgi:DNA-directed RNA polymerase subunit beta
MQSLALDVNVVSEEGERAEMREEDDDLLRAAEELGIDLSGVRATDGAADEATEHEGETVEASEEEAESEDPDLEPGEELEEEDFASDDDAMIDPDIAAGEAEGVLEEDER